MQIVQAYENYNNYKPGDGQGKILMNQMVINKTGLDLTGKYLKY